MESVVYGCHHDFALDGNLRSVCQQDGKWSEKPSCNGKSTFRARTGALIMNWLLVVVNHPVFLIDSLWFTAPCNITIERGRILYQGKKLWIEDFKPNRILHNELVSVYCMNEDRNCSFEVRTQCRDGRLDIPECFEGKGLVAAFWIEFTAIRAVCREEEQSSMRHEFVHLVLLEFFNGRIWAKLLSTGMELYICI